MNGKTTESGKIDFEFEELEFMGLIKENVGELTPYGKRLMKKYGKAIRSVAARVEDESLKRYELLRMLSSGQLPAITLPRLYAPKKEGTE